MKNLGKTILTVSLCGAAVFGGIKLYQNFDNVKSNVVDFADSLTGEDLQKQIDTLTAEKINLQKTLDSVTAERDSKQNTIEILTTSKTNLEADISGLQAYINDLIASGEASAEELTDLQDMLDSKKSELASLNTQIEDLSSQLTTANANLVDLNSQLNTASAQITDLTSQLETANIQISNLQSQLEESTSSDYSYQGYTFEDGGHVISIGLIDSYGFDSDPATGNCLQGVDFKNSMSSVIDSLNEFDKIKILYEGSPVNELQNNFTYTEFTNYQTRENLQPYNIIINNDINFDLNTINDNESYYVDLTGYEIIEGVYNININISTY